MCPPGLHISLGIFYRLFNLLEEECHELDLAHNLQGASAGPSYERCLDAVRQKNLLADKIRMLEDDVANLQQMITLFSISQPPNPAQTLLLRSLSSTMSSKQTEIDAMVNSLHSMCLNHLQIIDENCRNQR